MKRPTRLSIPVLAVLAATNVDAATLDIAVTDIETAEGFIMLALFDSADAFDNGGEAVRAVRLAVDGAEVTTRFENLPAGNYAIKLYHDANGNGEMDTNALGLPVEGYGFSNDAGRFGAPPFADAAFEVVNETANQAAIRVR